MASNFPGPYEIELIYTASTLQHVAKYNVNLESEAFPGDPTLGMNVKQRDGGLTAITTAVSGWVTLMKAIYNTGATFDTWNLWKYTPGTFDRVFINSTTLGVAGLNASSSNQNHQSTMTFRTAEGGVMKLACMDDVLVNEDRIPYAAASAFIKLMMDFVISGDNWILARDTSYPIAAMNEVGGENERLFRIRHR